MIKKVYSKVAERLRIIRAFYKRGNRLIRSVKYFVTFVALFVILTAAAAEYTSRPAFCPTCHYMESFYQSWRTSKHNKIDCVECHFEPGMSGTIKGKLNGLVQIVNYISLSYKKRKPWAEIPNNTCARSGCHETQALSDTTYNFKGIEFSHKHHLEKLKRGKTLKCTSCHSQIVQGTHIEVTTTTCFNCHFKKSDDPEHKYDKLAECTTCHQWDKVPKEKMANFRYDHTLVSKNKISCYSCHTNTIVGDGDVAKDRCFQCHFESSRLEKYKDTEFMHHTHIDQHSMPCYNCHSPIQHKIQKMDPNAPPDCVSCHDNAHKYQVSLFTGENGFNVEKTPSIMYLNGINCKGCHIFHEFDKKDIGITKAGESSCEKCHGKGYDKLIDQWKATTAKRLNTINTIYRTVTRIVSSSNSQNKKEAENILTEAYHNIRIVEAGKSVHNIQFADKLLIGSYGLMKKSLSVIGSSTSLPDFSSGSEFIPNECYNCHVGIQDITVKKYDMNFSHNQHIVKSRIPCTKCHSNATKHGELIVTKENCNACHHSEAKTNDMCAKCHSFQVQIYNGTFAGKNQPDFMKQGNVACVDCHMKTDKLIKPDGTICSKCHDNSYEKTMSEWKKEIGALSLEAYNLNNAAKNKDLSDADKNEINEIRKLLIQINSYPSIYVHNSDLISTILSEKIKYLKKLK